MFSRFLEFGCISHIEPGRQPEEIKLSYDVDDQECVAVLKGGAAEFARKHLNIGDKVFLQGELVNTGKKNSTTHAIKMVEKVTLV